LEMILEDVFFLPLYRITNSQIIGNQNVFAHFHD
jgi:hypothetical protein